MTLELIKKDQDLIIDFEAKLEACKNFSSKVLINSNEELDGVTANLKKIKDRRKELDKRRKEIVKPHNDFVKFVNKKLNPIVGDFKLVEDEIDKKAQSYLFDIQEKARIAKEAEEKRIADELKAKEAVELAKLKEEKENFEISEDEIKQKEKEIKDNLAIEKAESELKIVQPVVPKMAGLTEYLKFEILTPSDVPRELCLPDPVKIRKAGKALEFDKEVVFKGIKFYKEFKSK